MKRFLSVFTALVLALLSVSLLPRLPETPFLPAAAAEAAADEYNPEDEYEPEPEEDDFDNLAYLDPNDVNARNFEDDIDEYGSDDDWDDGYGPDFDDDDLD